MGMHVCVWRGVGDRWDYTIACSFLFLLHVPLFFSMGSLQKGGPSVPGSLLNSAFMGSLLSACGTLCHGSGGSWVCWGRGLSSLLIVWDPGGLPSVTVSWRLSLL